MANQKQDDYLLQSLINGDDKGIKEIYKKVYPKVRNYILSHDGSEDDAKDIMQKSLLQLLARAQATDFKIKSSFDGYFVTIAKNLWRRAAKMSKSRVTNEGVLDLVHEEREIALAAYEQEKWELFQEKLSEISQNCREVLTFFFNKVPYIDIAKKLGYATENTVRQRIFKCKSKLKEAIYSDKRYNELKEL